VLPFVAFHSDPARGFPHQEPFYSLAVIVVGALLVFIPFLAGLRVSRRNEEDG
jgi:hypothetical protein